MGSFWHQDSFDTDAYPAAVGIEWEKPGPEFLENLTRAHLEKFPFAHVDILLGDHPGVEPVNVQRQIVDHTRGGHWFERAQLFAAEAEDFGFTVRRQLGRVHTPYNTRTHLTVPVLAEGSWFLTDSASASAGLISLLNWPTNSRSHTVSLSREEQSRLLHVLDGWAPTVAETPRLPWNQQTDKRKS